VENPNRDKRIFLLGGRDLEMEEIFRLLRDSGEAVYPVSLDALPAWSEATLSRYAAKIENSPNAHIYAIELNIDERNDPLYFEYQDHITIIDHHGKEHNHKEASLLQILTLLNITPTRDQQLIAANDARYINGMKCIGATASEIATIRKRDRQAQGIIHSDEVVAKNDAKNRTVQNGIAVVCASTPHFSAITDSLYFDYDDKQRKDTSIIYNDAKIVFYGFDLESMQELCEQMGIKEQDYYYGGGNQGYFGIKENHISR